MENFVSFISWVLQCDPGCPMLPAAPCVWLPSASPRGILGESGMGLDVQMPPGILREHLAWHLEGSTCTLCRRTGSWTGEAALHPGTKSSRSYSIPLGTAQLDGASLRGGSPGSSQGKRDSAGTSMGVKTPPRAGAACASLPAFKAPHRADSPGSRLPASHIPCHSQRLPVFLHRYLRFLPAPLPAWRCLPGRPLAAAPLPGAPSGAPARCGAAAGLDAAGTPTEIPPASRGMRRFGKAAPG